MKCPKTKTHKKNTVRRPWDLKNIYVHLKQENGASVQLVRAIKKLFLETYPHIKFEDGSEKQNFLIVCINWLVLGQFKEEMVSGEGFSVT